MLTNPLRSLSDGSLSDTAVGNIETQERRGERNLRFDPRIGGGGGKQPQTTSGAAGAAAGGATTPGGTATTGAGGRPGLGQKSNSTSQLSASGKHRGRGRRSRLPFVVSATMRVFVQLRFSVIVHSAAALLPTYVSSIVITTIPMLCIVLYSAQNRFH